MFKNILLPIYEGRPAACVVPYALALAENHQASLTFLTVLENSASAEEESKAEDFLKNTTETVFRDTKGEYPISWSIERGELEKTVAKYVTEHQCDLVCLASSVTKGLLQRITGNHSERILRAVSCPVLVADHEVEKPWGLKFSHLLIPIDYVQDNNNAIELGKEMASKLGLSITLFTMVYQINNTNNTDIIGLATPVDDFINKANFDEAHEHLDKVATQIEALGIPTSAKTVIGNDSANEIVKAIAENSCDLTIMTTRESTPAKAFFMGSNVSKIISMNCLPILMIKQNRV